MKYRRVTIEDRLRIKDGLDAGLSKSAIADKLGFNKSTIGREISRNTGGRGYRPKQASALARAREEAKHWPYKLDPIVITMITERLELKWSPEQISNRLRLEGGADISTETIYRFIDQDRNLGGDLWRHLRRSSRRRKRRFPSEDRRGQIKNAIPISERSKGANKRKKLGHWERDTMLGKNRKTGVLVITDRKSRFNKFRKLNRRFAPKVTQETMKALKGLPVKSITNDRGQEFSDHERCAKKMKVQIYFCDPYSSYQRGTNENRIGILRQYFPKKTDLTNLSNKELKKIEFEINNRPMKCLDWLTPYEVMMKKSCTGNV
jgi:transposase, IS30 family